MGIDFDISEGGKIEIVPIKTREELGKRLRRVSKADFRKECNFVGAVLNEISQGLNKSSPETTLIGFVGLPFTLASYLVEGKTGVGDNFPNIRKLMEENPDVLHDMLSLLADNIVNYACYQIESGAQIIQVFDSWAGHIGDEYYGLFCEPYQRRVVQGIKQQHPETPIIIYMAPGHYSSGGRRLKALAETGVDIVGVDHTIDVSIAREILSDYDSVGLQGNLDPQILRDGPLDEIRSRTLAILENMRGRKRCILNLGHGEKDEA
jgi:uroporphyrinogen decarboxylase